MMEHNNKLKEEIGWLKVIFAMSIATTLSEGAWVLQNYGKTTRVLLILNTLGALIFMLISIGINRVAYRKINQLED